MNKTLYFLGGTLLGIILGGVPTYLYMKKKNDELLDDFNNMEEYYTRTSEYDYEEDVDVNPVYDDVKEKLEKNYEQTTNYAEMYNKGDAANHEHPLDDDEEEDYELEDDVDEAVSMTEEHNKNKDKKPKIISESALGDLPPYVEVETLFYYEGDDVLSTENDEEILDPEYYVGDSLTKYGFKDSDEERIYVMNYSLDKCYDIQKVEGNFYNETAG